MAKRQPRGGGGNFLHGVSTLERTVGTLKKTYQITKFGCFVPKNLANRFDTRLDQSSVCVCVFACSFLVVIMFDIKCNSANWSINQILKKKMSCKPETTIRFEANLMHLKGWKPRVMKKPRVETWNHNPLPFQPLGFFITPPTLSLTRLVSQEPHGHWQPSLRRSHLRSSRDFVDGKRFI